MNKNLDFLRPSFLKYWHLILITAVLSLVAAAFEGASVGLLIPFLRNLSEGANEAFATGVQWIDVYILGTNGSQLERLYRICALIVAATWLRGVFAYMSTVVGVTARARIIEDLRMRIVDQLQAVALGFYSKKKTGDLISNFTAEIGRLAQSFTVLITVITEGSLLLMYLGLMVWISWELTLVAVVFFGGLSLGLSSLINSIRERGRALTRTDKAFVTRISEFIHGVRTVIAYNMQPHERSRLRTASNDIAEAVIEVTRRRGLVGPLSQGLVTTALILIVMLSVQFLVLTGELDIVLLLTFLFAMLRLMPIVHQLNGQRGQYAQFQGALESIGDLLRTDDKPYLPDGPNEAPPLRSSIRFETVSFAYERPDRILKDINATLPAGKTTALVGTSGAGKSTLADLVPRFYDPTDGRILWDGTDLRSFTKESLRDKIAVVSQDTFIFNTTVTENIRYGALDAMTEDVHEAAEMANALAFIEDLPEGWDTILGERGVRLSGGQRQRIAIARAILRNPDLLILDEATSALDSISERLVQKSLERLMRGRTVLAIAHRLSTIQNAELVLVLEDGRIVESGSYATLLQQKGKLWTFHKSQHKDLQPADATL